jgi:hypothetical protein
VGASKSGLLFPYFDFQGNLLVNRLRLDEPDKD